MWFDRAMAHRPRDDRRYSDARQSQRQYRRFNLAGRAYRLTLRADQATKNARPDKGIALGCAREGSCGSVTAQDGGAPMGDRRRWPKSLTLTAERKPREWAVPTGMANRSSALKLLA